MVSGRMLLRQDATQLFLAAMEIDADPIAELDQFLKACEQANPRYQGGGDLVRFQLEADDSKWPSRIRHATLNLANYLNMCRGEDPLKGGPYDVIIALGGARRSPLHRACYAAQAIVDNRTEAKLIVIAGSTRPLVEEEKGQVQDFAEGALTEYDLCLGAQQFVKKRYPDLNIVAVCNDDPRSGNDGVIDKTMAFCATHFGGAVRVLNLSVAAVTTRIYAQGLYLDMARAAKRHRWGQFLAAGHASDPEAVFKRKLAIYLSECLTTLRKAALAAAENC